MRAEIATDGDDRRYLKISELETSEQIVEMTIDDMNNYASVHTDLPGRFCAGPPGEVHFYLNAGTPMPASITQLRFMASLHSVLGLTFGEDLPLALHYASGKHYTTFTNCRHH